MKIKTVHRQFAEHCQNGTLKRRSPKTIENYQMTMALLLKWFPIEYIDELNTGILRQFFRYGETKRNWKPSTVVTHRKNLAPFLDWCVKGEFLPKSPLEEIPCPQLLKQIPEIYTERDIEKILYAVSTYANSDFARIRNTSVIAMFLMAGLRKGELISLKIPDVDFVHRCIRVRAENAKNRSPRVVMMTFRLEKILLDYWKARQKRNIDTYAFWVSSTRRTTFTRDGLNHLIKKISKKAGIRLKPHKCRHTFATQFYQGSKDLVSLQQILGHREITTTMIYTQVIPENTKDSLEKNPLNTIF